MFTPQHTYVVIASFVFSSQLLGVHFQRLTTWLCESTNCGRGDKNRVWEGEKKQQQQHTRAYNPLSRRCLAIVTSVQISRVSFSWHFPSRWLFCDEARKRSTGSSIFFHAFLTAVIFSPVSPGGGPREESGSNRRVGRVESQVITVDLRHLQPAGACCGRAARETEADNSASEAVIYVQKLTGWLTLWWERRSELAQPVHKTILPRTCKEIINFTWHFNSWLHGPLAEESCCCWWWWWWKIRWDLFLKSPGPLWKLWGGPLISAREEKIFFCESTSAFQNGLAKQLRPSLAGWGRVLFTQICLSCGCAIIHN